jgi:hypothetical protein
VSAAKELAVQVEVATPIKLAVALEHQGKEITEVQHITRPFMQAEAAEAQAQLVVQVHRDREEQEVQGACHR